ncbi:MAG: carboxypeptidase-like regulatory domain-containing protein [Candidatus Methylomirabilales bacterium]
MRHVSWGWLGLLLLLGVVSGCATADIPGPRVVTGRVTNPRGEPVVGNPVVLVGRNLGFTIPAWRYETMAQDEVKTETDAEGRYRFEVNPANLGNNFYLFFTSKRGFDEVRYRRVEPIDITRRLKGELVVTVNQVLEWHPNWPEVQRLIAEYGPGSDRGRILRQLGLPERKEGTETPGGKSEVWHYFRKGVTYRFENGVLVATHTFAPIPASED